jgi:hypothetical protein
LRTGAFFKPIEKEAIMDGRLFPFAWIERHGRASWRPVVTVRAITRGRNAGRYRVTTFDGKAHTTDTIRPKPESAERTMR